ncbi:MAG: hypothetical protein HYZ75_11595 [Elusimicrobia bacterium]|nr:hypothetical protein [Elusimicrobiota bacterium]
MRPGVRILLAGAACLLAAAACSAEAPRLAHPRLVRLWNQSTLENLENENRLAELCPESLAAERREACRREKLQSTSWSLALHAKPDPLSARLGALILTAAPGKGLSYSFVPAGSKSGVLFQPDQYDPDWGYGPLSDHTILDRKGDWVLLPSRPFPRPAWVNLKAGLGTEPDVYDPLTAGTVYSLNDDKLTLEKATPAGLLLRDEVPSDMSCGDPAPDYVEVKSPAVLFLWKELYDEAGHFRLTAAYPRGC